MVTRLSSREFNRDTAGAKRAAAHGPVYITDRGRVGHVLVTYENYAALTGHADDVLAAVAGPPGLEAVEFVVERSPDRGRAADLA